MDVDIVIHWEGQWLIGDYFSLPDDPRLQATMGIYSIHTGESDGELVYIGQAYDQSFARRVPQHQNDGLADWIEEEYAEIQLYLSTGHLGLKTYDRVTPQLVDDIESLLIGACRPPGNLSKTKTFSGRELLIRNKGSRGSVPRYCWAIIEDSECVLYADEDPPEV